MICKFCNSQVVDNALFCPYCGTNLTLQKPQEQNVPQGQNVPQVTSAGVPPEGNYNKLLIPGLLALFCCCGLPLGIFSLIKVNKANELLLKKDFAGAEAAAKEARMWGIIALVVGGIGQFLFFIFYLILLVASA